MSHFYTENQQSRDFSNYPEGLTANHLIKLISGHEFEDELKESYKEILENNEVINILGAKHLVDLILKRDSTFLKFDITQELDDINFHSTELSDSFTLEFKNIQNEKALSIIGDDSFIANTIHSSKSDFLEGLFRFKKYSDYLYSNGLNELVTYNLGKLKEKYGNEKRYERSYRILKDSDNQYFIRAITSTGRYFDYNIRFSVFLTLISLHCASKINQKEYSISHFTFDESRISLSIEQTGLETIEKVGQAKFYIELSNDEIKREALKLRGLGSIYFEDDSEVFIQPRENKNYDINILSVSHGHLPSTWLKRLDQMTSAIRNVQENLIRDIKQIKNIKSPGQLRFALSESFRRASSERITGYKNEIDHILSGKVQTISDLLKRMNKITILANEDLDAKLYIRYVFHDHLSKLKK